MAKKRKRKKSHKRKSKVKTYLVKVGRGKFMKVRSTQLPMVLKVVKRQAGRSAVYSDKMRRALKPGKRISKHGRIYYEYRKNRSDLRKRI